MTSKEDLKKIKELNSVGLTAEDSLFKAVEKDLEKLKKIKEIFLVTKISLQTILDTKTTLQTNIIDPTIIKAQAYDKIIEVLKHD